MAVCFVGHGLAPRGVTQGQHYFRSPTIQELLISPGLDASISRPEQMAIANTLTSSYRDGCRFLDLAPLSDHKLVPSALREPLRTAGEVVRRLPPLDTPITR